MVVGDVTQNHIFSAFDGSGVNVCFGDSGGPMLNSSGDVVGIVSAGSNESCDQGDVTTFTNLNGSKIRDWLRLDSNNNPNPTNGWFRFAD
jgi:S1-C subfamily serine protease